jgi:FkbM family methyltransferase
VGLLNSLWGNKYLQKVFESLHRVALKGMNYGRASDYENNGESIVLKELRTLIHSTSPVLFDVGANQGQFTKRIMQVWAAKPYSLYVFEPSTVAFEKLKASVASSPDVHLINLALSDKRGKAALFYDREGSGLASVYPRDLAFRRIDFSGHEEIEMTTLDQFCEDRNIATIDFLKLDVEGHEFAVLKGGKRMFDTGNVKVVQFEFGGCSIDSRTFFKDYFTFFKKDFILYRILSNGLREIEGYEVNLEVYQSANYLAVKK